jgi:membrane associated rhomboid family serine protease
MILPLKDLSPRRSYPLINTLLIAANVLVFLYQFTLPERAFKAFLLNHATVPVRFHAWLGGHIPLETVLWPLLTSMFVHAGLTHLAGNMLFLWVFGDHVEDFYGHLAYLLFYLLCGVGSELFHVFFSWHSTVPAIGASGAISGVMGAYAVTYPRAQILTLVFIFLVPLPAVIILGYWFLLQFLAGLSSLAAETTGGVAWWAHVGGFLLGFLLTRSFRRR